MTIYIRIMQALNGLAGLGALTLGLLHWLNIVHLIENVHMPLGLLVALTLLIVSITMLFVPNMRLWGVAGIIYAPIVVAFGMTQFYILPGSFHWIIQTLHLLVGLGALALNGIMCNRYLSMVGAKGVEASRAV